MRGNEWRHTHTHTRPPDSLDDGNMSIINVTTCKETISIIKG